MCLYVYMDSDLDDSEDSYTRNADACMTNWHNRDDVFPVPPVLSNSECTLIHSDLLNDG